MDGDLGATVLQVGQQRGVLSDVVARGPQRRRGPRDRPGARRRFTRLVLPREKEIRRLEPAFNLGVPVDVEPDIAAETKVYSRKREDSRPVLPKSRPDELGVGVSQVARNQRARDETKDLTVIHVIAHVDEVDVMGQTDSEVAGARPNGDLQQRQPGAQDPAAKEVDMYVNRRYGRVLGRLPFA